MAQHKTGIVHHIGTFLLFVAFVLLLVTSISAPVINDVSLLKVTLTNRTHQRNSSVTFGTFGHCILDVPPVTSDQDWCSGSHIGYDPARIMTAIESTDFSTASRNTADGLTRVMVLHPICCALAFIAFCLALGAGFLGGFLASIVAALTWILTLVVMVTDFVSFGIVKDHVNGDGSGSHAVFGSGMWMVLAAMVCLFIATFVVLFSCCSKRSHKKQNHKEAAYVDNGSYRKRHFWQRSNKY